ALAHSAYDSRYRPSTTACGVPGSLAEPERMETYGCSHRHAAGGSFWVGECLPAGAPLGRTWCGRGLDCGHRRMLHLVCAKLVDPRRLACGGLHAMGHPNGR